LPRSRYQGATAKQNLATLFSSFSSTPEPYSFTNSAGGAAGIVAGDGWQFTVDTVPLSFTLCLPLANASEGSTFTIPDFAVYDFHLFVSGFLTIWYFSPLQIR